MQRISSLAENRSAFQEGLCYMELFSFQRPELLVIFEIYQYGDRHKCWVYGRNYLHKLQVACNE
jgi:hypothetical protein